MPRLNGKGRIIAGVGDGGISLDGETIAAVGGCACWLDDNRAMYRSAGRFWTHDTRDGTRTDVGPGGNELAAGGGDWLAWAEKDAAGERLGVYGRPGIGPWKDAGLAGTNIANDGRGERANDGATAFIPDRASGALTLILGGPTPISIPGVPRSIHVLSGTDAIYADGNGRLVAIGLPQPLAHPVPVSAVRHVAIGARRFLLITENERLILRQWDSLRGAILVNGPFGFNADAVALHSFIRAAWSRGAGELPGDIKFRDLTLAELDADLSPGAPAPNPPTPVPIPPPPPTRPPVSTPNRFEIVQRVFAEHRDLARENTGASCGRLTEHVAIALSEDDDGWGLLSKSPGQNQFNGHAVDAVIYKATQQVVDVIAGAGAREDGENQDAAPTWIEQPKRPDNNWMAPIGVTPRPPGQPPTPPAPDGTHQYAGGGNDTGTCDQCGRPRTDPVHAIPKSKVAHAYDGGEQDTGLCDVCQKPREDAIHETTAPGPGPEPPKPPAPKPEPGPTPPIPPGADKLDLILAEVRRIGGHFQ